MSILYIFFIFFNFIYSSYQMFIINYEPYIPNKENVSLLSRYSSSYGPSCMMKRVCYYAIPSPSSWDKTLKNLLPEEIDPFICTHIIVAFAKIENNTIQPKNSSDLEIYRKVLHLKTINPQLKVMLSLNSGFQDLVKNQDSINLFAFNAAQTLRDMGFDGLDLDWEFPAWPASIWNWREKGQFTYLVTQLWNSLKLSSHPPFILSIAVAAPVTIVRSSYEVDKLSENVDFINLMGYDFRMYKSYFPFTGFNSPLHKGKFDMGYFATLNIEFAANYWVSKGAPKNKLVIGIPTYGRTWKLLSFVWHKLHAPAVGPGMLGGYVSYPEALNFLTQGASSVFDEYSLVPYSYMGRDWVSYEDRKSIYEKAIWIKNESFSGVMTWNLNCDDFTGEASGRKFDLQNVIKEVTEC